MRGSCANALTEGEFVTLVQGTGPSAASVLILSAFSDRIPLGGKAIPAVEGTITITSVCRATFSPTNNDSKCDVAFHDAVAKAPSGVDWRTVLVLALSPNSGKSRVTVSPAVKFISARNVRVIDVGSPK